MNPGEDLSGLEYLEDHIATVSAVLREAIRDAVNVTEAETVRALARALVQVEVALIQVANKRNELL